MVKKITLETDLVESLKEISNSINEIVEAIQCNNVSESTVKHESTQFRAVLIRF